MPNSPKKIAVVTGANRGLGLETSHQLAQKGYHVCMLGRSKDKIEQATQSLKAKGLKEVSPYVVDVEKAEQINAFSKTFSKDYSRLDCLVNNAAVLMDSPDGCWSEEPNALTVEADVIKKTFEINTLGALLMSQALIPMMQKNKSGCIVNVSSGAATLAHMSPGALAYRISKTALNAVTKVLAEELKADNIHVNSISPGWVRTEMGGQDASKSVEEGAKGIVWAATLPEDGPTGGFFREGETLEW